MKNSIITPALSIVTAATIAVTAAFNISGFNDYNPPSTLMIQWYDYFASSLQDSPSNNNSKTSWPRWSAEFPYRACFFGGRYMNSGSYQQKYEARVYWVYSKKPVSDVFTFEYIADNRNNGTRTGYIRASFSKNLDYGPYVVAGTGGYEYYDLHILEQTSAEGIIDGTQNLGQISTLPTYAPSVTGREANGKYYFEFDFLYDCLDKHQTNAQNLNVSGAKGVSNIPYPYILTCDAHGSGGATSGSGGGSSSGSSGGGSSGSVSSIPPVSKWPDASLPSPWQPKYDTEYPWQDDKNTPDLGKNPDVPSVPPIGEGQYTGEQGDTWDLPSWTIPDLSDFEETDIPPMPEISLPSLDIPVPEFPDVPTPDNPLFPDIPALDNPTLPDIPALDNPTLPDIPALDNPALPDIPALDNPVLPDIPALDNPILPDIPALTNPVFPDIPYETPNTTWPPPFPY